MRGAPGVRLPVDFFTASCVVSEGFPATSDVKCEHFLLRYKEPPNTTRLFCDRGKLEEKGKKILKREKVWNVVVRGSGEDKTK